MNKEHWSSVILDGSVPNGELRKMAAGSYELVAGTKKSRKFSAFAANVYRAVRNIPAGRVATYGQIAALAGHPGAARAVGSLMRNCPREAGMSLLPGDFRKRKAGACRDFRETGNPGAAAGGGGDSL